ncbi:MAG: Ltp family lipoprotein, partial [Slackia piriformis]|nr:Ltp family lipoprotein [Slackia piriformis]
LIDQIEYEKYSLEDATFAADHCGADWNEQAARVAQRYIDVMSFSRGGLIDQLEYEGFNQEQATYGADAVGL